MTFQRFCSVREAVFPGGADYAARMLVSVQGAPVQNDNLLVPLETLLAKAGEKPCTIPFNWIRKTIETTAAELLDQTAQDEASSGIMRYLCHSREVTKLHYRFRTDKVIVRQYRQVEYVLALTAALGEVDKRRLQYLPAHWNGECVCVFIPLEYFSSLRTSRY